MFFSGISSKIKPFLLRCLFLGAQHREIKMNPQLRSYSCSLTLDPNTANRHLSLSDGNRKLCSSVEGGGSMEAFSSKDLAMKAQKKFLSHMASKSMAQMMVDDTSGEVLDELYRVSKLHTGNRAEAQKVLKNLVKVAVKVAILIRHDKFSKDELKVAQEFRKKLHNGAMTAISFQEVEYTFDKAVMIEILNECRDLLIHLVENHLTPKSVGRIQHVFNHYSDPELLTHLYEPKGTLWPSLSKICSGLNRMIEENKL
ncbi:hypothetical protein SRHO_G00103530 [Serrasalmus rhombeus]